MKGTFTAVLNTPSTVYANTSSKKSVYAFYIDGSNMISGDTLKVIINTDCTGVERTVLTDYVSVQTLNEDKVALSFPLLIEANDTYSIILEQTTGIAKTYGWCVSTIEY